MSRAVALRIRFWGVRGSHPTPGPSTVRVGGNSSCVEIHAGGCNLVFDAGTGIIGLGQDLLQRGGARTAHIFLSHTHHDHIEGLRFFQPVYVPGWQCFLYGGGSGPRTIEHILSGIMRPRLFPVSFSELPNPLSIRTLSSSERIHVPGSTPRVVVEARHSDAHPKVGVMMYRITCGHRTVVYATDVEAPKGGHEDVVEFARGADVLIHDAQYTDAEYFSADFHKVGWGHSTVRMAAEAARAADVGELILYHHDPSHNDAEIRRIEHFARRLFPRTRAAVEGLELRLAPPRTSS